MLERVVIFIDLWGVVDFRSEGTRLGACSASGKGPTGPYYSIIRALYNIGRSGEPLISLGHF